MVKKKGLKKFNISNKLAYTLMIILSIALLGIGVVAYNLPPPTNVGHTLNELQVPSGCVAGQVMKLSGGVWACGVDDETDSRFTITTSGLCYNAPATCSTEILSCSEADETSIPLSSSEDCFSIPSSTRASRCIAACQSDLGMYPCDGRSSNQASCVGTTVTWGSTTGGICEVSDEITCHCRASGTYTDATYTAAGQRCI